MVDFLRKIIPTRPAEEKKTLIQDIVPKGIPLPHKIEGKLLHPKSIPKAENLPEAKPPPIKPARLPTLTSFRTKEKTDTGLTVRAWEPESVKRSPTLRMLAWARKIATLRLLVGAVTALLFASFIILTTVFARVTITIRPVAAVISIPKTVLVADARIHAPDPAAKKIPALRLSTELTERGTFPSSGKKYIEAVAKGTVTVFNTLDDRAQVLIQNTRLADPDGKVFKLTRAVTIPGASVREGKIVPSSVQAEVIAEKPGEDYNIGPARFSIPGFKGTPKYANFFGESKEAMRGGFRGEAKVVTVQDIKAGQEKVTAALFERLRGELEKKIPTGDEFITLDGSRSILINELKNPKPDERLDEFSVEARGNALVIIFKKSDLFSILGSLFLSPERPSLLIENTETVKFANVRLETGESRLAFEVEGEATAVRVIRAEEIRAESVAKRVSKLESYLRGRPEISGFNVNNFPSWRWATPKRAEAVRVKIELLEPIQGANL